tara:strand:- start:586 stop:750 length:165 start_codon:yes stop_codon:yes gene_type:complete
MNDLLSIIEKWKTEAFSSHNDGWTQNGYRKMLIEVRDYLNNIDELELHREDRDA